jgi:hypothetical protein
VSDEAAMRLCRGHQVTWRDSDPLGPSDCGEDVRAANRDLRTELAELIEDGEDTASCENRP